MRAPSAALVVVVLVLPCNTHKIDVGGDQSSHLTGYKFTSFYTPVDGMDAMEVTYGESDDGARYSVYTPKLPFSQSEKSFPTIMWYGEEGRTEMVEIAATYGLIAVFPHPVQGEWDIPRVFNDKTGPKCDHNTYATMHSTVQMLKELESRPNFDMNRLFLAGCSMGAAMALYVSNCIDELNPGKVRAFATFGQGLKVKGDGNHFPFETVLSGKRHVARVEAERSIFFRLFSASPSKDLYEHGECPNCKYWPTVLNTKGSMKACIFDSTTNPSAAHPFYYHSSEKLASEWKRAGHTAVTYFTDGGSTTCNPPSLLMLDCLNDDKGELLRGVRIHLIIRTETAKSFDAKHRKPLLTTALANMLSNGVRMQDVEFIHRENLHAKARLGKDLGKIAWPGQDDDIEGLRVHYTIHFRRSSSENIADVIAGLTNSATFTGGIAADLQRHGWNIQAKDLAIAEDFEDIPIKQGASSVLRLLPEVIFACFALSLVAVAVSKFDFAKGLSVEQASEYGQNTKTHFGGGPRSYGYNSVL
jgi:hypothetical protein